MAYYQVMNTTDSTDMAAILNYINVVSGYIFFPVMLLVAWLIWVIGSVFMGKQLSRGIFYASFVCSILAIVLVLLNWLSPNYMYFAFFLTAVGLIWVRLEEAPS